MTGAHFAAVFPQAWTGWRLVAVDLPHFGGTSWEGEIQPANLTELLAAIRNEFEVEEVHVLAFSLGARIALGLVAQGTLPVRTAILISPDGLRLHPLYRFAVYTWLGRWAFRGTMRWPGWLLFLNQSLYKLRLQGASQYEFVRRQLRDPADRHRLYQVWMAYRQCPPTLANVKQGARQAGTSWHVIWGKQDRITPFRLGKKFLQQFPETTAHHLPGGHFLLRPTADKLIALVKSIVIEQ